MSMPGGMSGVKPADAEAQSVADQVKAAAEAKAGKSFGVYKVVHYATQVVAGMNYFLKVDVGSGEHVHLRVFRGLGGSAPALSAIQTGKSASDPLTYF